MGTKSRFSATDRTLITSRLLEPRSTDRTLPASGHLPPDAFGHSFVALEPLCTRPDSVILRPVDLLVQRPVAATVEPLDWGIRSLCYQRPVQRPVTSVSSFLCDLACGLVPIFVLGLCLISCVFSCASRVLLKVLIIGSSRHLHPSHVSHPIELQNSHLQIH